MSGTLSSDGPILDRGGICVREPQYHEDWHHAYLFLKSYCDVFGAAEHDYDVARWLRRKCGSGPVPFDEDFAYQTLTPGVERARVLTVLVCAEGPGYRGGMVVLKLDDGRIEPLHLWVEPDHRRRGVASILAEAGTVYADSHRLDAVFWARSNDSASVSLYRHLGYQPVLTAGEFEMYQRTHR